MFIPKINVTIFIFELFKLILMANFNYLLLNKTNKNFKMSYLEFEDDSYELIIDEDEIPSAQSVFGNRNVISTNELSFDLSRKLTNEEMRAEKSAEFIKVDYPRKHSSEKTKPFKHIFSSDSEEVYDLILMNLENDKSDKKQSRINLFEIFRRLNIPSSDAYNFFEYISKEIYSNSSLFIILFYYHELSK